MPTFYRLADKTGHLIGMFDSPDEAKRLVPEVARWEQVPGRDEDFDGWRPDGSYFQKRPDFTIRAVDA